jgi:hypothetical protein
MKKFKNFTLALAITLVLLAATTSGVFASSLNQGGQPFNTENEAANQGQYLGQMYGRGGRWSSGSAPQSLRSDMIEAVSGVTGLSVEEIEASIANGERLFAIALDAGMTEVEYFDLMKATRDAFWAERVEAGEMSEAQYQWMLQHQQGDPDSPGLAECFRYDGAGTGDGYGMGFRGTRRGSGNRGR